MRRVEFLDPSNPRFGSDDEITDEELERDSDEREDYEFESHRDEVLEERRQNEGRAR